MYPIQGVIGCRRVTAEELPACIGRTVQIHGMVHKLRRMHGFAFVLLRTRETVVQCVWSEQDSAFPLETLIENESVVFTADVVADARSRAGYELRLREVRALSLPAEQPPVVCNGKEMTAGIETLLDYRALTLRHPQQRAIFRIQAGICRAIRAFLDREGFTELHTPKILHSGAEGGANIFALDYFGEQAYLAQSPQFYKQMMVGVFERVYEIAPVFRAERHDTARHLNEYTSVDLEMGFLDGFADLMELETALLRSVIDQLGRECAPELALCGARLPDVGSIPALRFDEAKEWIARACNRPLTDPEDFAPEEERLLCELVQKETGSELVFVTHYHSGKRPFYAKDDPDTPGCTLSFDLLLRGMEITTGGERICGYDEQVEKMRARGMDVARFARYLMAHRCGLPPHGGLGLGLERLTARLLNLPNVRQATLFPRDCHRLEP